jgi:hypothetical protein
MGLTGRVTHVNRSAVTVAADGSVDYGLPPVTLGDTVMPARVAYVIEGSHSSPSLQIEFEIRKGQPVCVDVHVEASPGGRGIRTGDLNTLPGLDKLAEEVFLGFATKRPDPDKPFDWFIRGQQERKAAKQDVHTRGDAELKEVVRVYRANVSGRPVAAVEELGYSRRTAARRIQQARSKGLLPPTTQGKRKA